MGDKKQLSKSLVYDEATELIKKPRLADRRETESGNDIIVIESDTDDDDIERYTEVGKHAKDGSGVCPICPDIGENEKSISNSEVCEVCKDMLPILYRLSAAVPSEDLNYWISLFKDTIGNLTRRLKTETNQKYDTLKFKKEEETKIDKNLKEKYAELKKVELEIAKKDVIIKAKEQLEAEIENNSRKKHAELKKVQAEIAQQSESLKLKEEQLEKLESKTKTKIAQQDVIIKAKDTWEEEIENNSREKHVELQKVQAEIAQKGESLKLKEELLEKIESEIKTKIAQKDVIIKGKEDWEADIENNSREKYAELKKVELEIAPKSELIILKEAEITKKEEEEAKVDKILKEKYDEVKKFEEQTKIICDQQTEVIETLQNQIETNDMKACNMANTNVKYQNMLLIQNESEIKIMTSMVNDQITNSQLQQYLPSKFQDHQMRSSNASEMLAWEESQKQLESSDMRAPNQLLKVKTMNKLLSNSIQNYTTNQILNPVQIQQPQLSPSIQTCQATVKDSHRIREQSKSSTTGSYVSSPCGSDRASTNWSFGSSIVGRNKSITSGSLRNSDSWGNKSLQTIQQPGISVKQTIQQPGISVKHIQDKPCHLQQFRKIILPTQYQGAEQQQQQQHHGQLLHQEQQEAQRYNSTNPQLSPEQFRPPTGVLIDNCGAVVTVIPTSQQQQQLMQNTLLPGQAQANPQLAFQPLQTVHSQY